MTDQDLTLVATANINPMRFIKLGTAANYSGTECDANEAPIGISEDGTRNAPGTAADDGYIAISGESFKVFGPGRKCLVECGGTVAAGDRLKSDADGKAVAIATSGTTIQNVGARALQAGTSGQRIYVVVENYPLRPALA